MFAEDGHVTLTFRPGGAMSDLDAERELVRLGAARPRGAPSDACPRWGACGLRDDGTVALWRAAFAPDCAGESLADRYRRSGVPCVES